MSSASQESAALPNSQLSEFSQRLQQAYTDDQSDVSLIILHMSELLTSFVREDTPEKRAKWAAALADVRNGVNADHAHEELRFISDFSIMLEDGLQCLADKCAKLEQAVKSAPPREHDYVYGRSPASAIGSPPVLAAAAVAATAAKAPRKAAAAGNAAARAAPAVRAAAGGHQRRGGGGGAKQMQLVLCDLCKRAQPRLRMANHLRREHPEEWRKIAKFRCPYCASALFIKQAAFEAHVQSCPVRLEEERVRLEHEKLLRRLPHTTQELMCRMCGLQSETLLELADHVDKMHPLCTILSCTGCGATFRRPAQVLQHWKDSKEQYAHSKCAASAPAALLPHAKLVSQVLAHAKANGADKDFAYIECMAQEVPCEDCGLVAKSFKQLYHHVHNRHNKIVQDQLLFGCLTCGLKYRSPPGLKEHLLRAEIEEYDGCCNAGVAYWAGERVSKDMRPQEIIEREELKIERAQTEQAAMDIDEGGEDKGYLADQSSMDMDAGGEIKREMESQFSMDADSGYNYAEDMPALSQQE